MKLFYQNIKDRFQGSGAKGAALLMLLSPFSVFANDGGSGLSDATVATILISMIIIQIALLYVIAGVFKSLAGNSSIWKKLLDGKKAAAVLTTLFVLGNGSVFAQGTDASPFILDPELETLLITINGFLLLMIVALLLNVRTIINALKGAPEEEVVEEDVFSSLGLTDAVPVEEEDTILLDHDYDGIHELDNNLPPWWLYGFYITIFLSGIYLWYYFTPENMDVGHNRFVAELAEAEKEAELRGASVDENTVKLLTSDADLKAGKKTFEQLCASCHLVDGGGDIGPNLTDEYWIHGGGINNIFSTIKYGVLEKGMVAWESTLSPNDMARVASYIISLEGTTPAQAKEPQGQKWEGE